jgi:hypothetical protein
MTWSTIKFNGLKMMKNRMMINYRIMIKIKLLWINFYTALIDFFRNITFIYLVKIIAYLIITRIIVHILIEVPFILNLYIFIIFAGISIEYYNANKTILKYKIIKFFALIGQNKTYFITYMLISRLFIVILFFLLILLLTNVNCLFINNYVIPYLSLSPLMILVNTSIIAEYIHLAQEILGLTFSLNMEGQNGQQGSNSQQSGPNGQHNPNGQQGPNPQPGNNSPPVYTPLNLASIINDDNTLSPVEIMIKNRILDKLLEQREEQRGKTYRKYALSTVDFKPEATLNSEERAIVLKLVRQGNTGYSILEIHKDTPRHEEIVVRGIPNSFSNRAIADKNFMRLFEV